MAEEMVAGHSVEEESSAEEDNSMSEDPSTVEDSVSEDSGAPTANRECWQFDPRYAKYWQHWHSMMGWYQRHRRAPAQVRAVWQHVMQNGYAPMEPCGTRTNHHWRSRHFRDRSHSGSRSHSGDRSHSGGRRSASTSRNPPTNSNAKQRRRRTKRNKKHRKRHKRKNANENAKQSDTDTMDSTGETGSGDVPEISPEFREFMAVTARHREERRRQREEAARVAAEEEDYIEADKLGLPRYGRTTTEAPAQQPGQQRKAEMKLLYGARAPVIHGLETAMQMEFDASCDLRQPKLWPTIPLKL